MVNVTSHEIEMLANLIATRMVITEIEIIWMNDILNRLRLMVQPIDLDKKAEA